MDSIKRFNGIVDFYAEGRPEYAPALIAKLYFDEGFLPTSIIADIGAGTGKFSRQLLKYGSEVFCIEPNNEMADKLRIDLADFEKMHLIRGNASDTLLSDHSVDFITSAQAFHWFDVAAFQKESKRIIKPDGKVILIWNVRDIDTKLNNECYAVYKQYCKNFIGFNGGISRDDERIKEFFTGGYERFEFDYPLIYDKETFIKRCISGSYSLKESDRDYCEYINAFKNIFNKYNCDEKIIMENKSVMYIGKIFDEGS